ncbi:hypothetical protein BDEG_27323 [Batrachochytrium dendrobatidis JEL423]|uniref:Prolyl endopeptidase-like n=1 Tax=Batrachochytrium dendrobatidis (strain JEL423) TaxID=403673 RepID=A0A177WX06_BATDL|nr:hypothetical protein BDEG_27323 [Batrachochytrium dendrobatidis JEL423]
MACNLADLAQQSCKSQIQTSIKFTSFPGLAIWNLYSNIFFPDFFYSTRNSSVIRYLNSLSFVAPPYTLWVCFKLPSSGFLFSNLRPRWIYRTHLHSNRIYCTHLLNPLQSTTVAIRPSLLFSTRMKSFLSKVKTVFGKKHRDGPTSPTTALAASVVAPAHPSNHSLPTVALDADTAPKTGDVSCAVDSTSAVLDSATATPAAAVESIKAAVADVKIPGMETKPEGESKSIVADIIAAPENAVESIKAAVADVKIPGMGAKPEGESKSIVADIIAAPEKTVESIKAAVADVKIPGMETKPEGENKSVIAGLGVAAAATATAAAAAVGMGAKPEGESKSIVADIMAAPEKAVESIKAAVADVKIPGMEAKPEGESKSIVADIIAAPEKAVESIKAAVADVKIPGMEAKPEGESKSIVADIIAAPEKTVESIKAAVAYVKIPGMGAKPEGENKSVIAGLGVAAAATATAAAAAIGVAIPGMKKESTETVVSAAAETGVEPALASSKAAATLDALKPPVAKKIPIQHEYHGVKYSDDYHWLKDQSPKNKKPEIIEYLEAENAYSKAFHYDKTKSLSETLYKEMIAKINENDSSVPVYKAPYSYYSQVVQGQQYRIFLRKKDTADAVEEVYLDQNKLEFEYQFMGDVSVSPDHKTLAYALDTTGSEHYTIFFKDLETGKALTSETLEGKFGSSIEWANDSKTVYLTTLDDIDRAANVVAFTVGAASKIPRLVFHEPDSKFNVGISKTTRYLFIYAVSGVTSECLNNTLMVCHESNTDASAWTELTPYDPFRNIQDVLLFKDYLVIRAIVGGFEKIIVTPISNGKLTGKLDPIAIEHALYTANLHSLSHQNTKSNTVRYEISTPLIPSQVWEFDMATGTSTQLKEVKVPGEFDSSLYTLERIYVPIPETTKTEAPFNTPTPETIPVSIMYRKDLFKKDGTNPLHLYGYGSYGISIPTAYSAIQFPILDRGYVYAIAHIRGGGSCGKAWYETGKFKSKRNTFTDFIACSQELVKLQYTQHELMSIEGRSAGGLLMGAVVNMKPDIAHVVIAGVPFVDVINTMMDPTIPLTINEYEEWGNPNDKEYFEYMRSYSPYDNIPSDKQFPNILVKAGLNDPRVAYWEPAKWVAKMRALDVCRGKTQILLHCTMGAGHFGVSGRYARYMEVASDFAFLVECMDTQRRAKGLLA